MPIETRDRRRQDRTPCSRQIWWRHAQDSLFQQGWLVDESPAGLAFITRTEDRVRPGESIQAVGAEPGTKTSIPRGVIRRVQPIQSGVTLIAVELFGAESAVVTRVGASATPSRSAA